MFLSPVSALSLWLRTAVMLAEAQAVIAMRLMGLAGLWRTGRAEPARMLAEKAAAAGQAAAAATRAALAGAGPAGIAGAALTPVARRTRANARRLARSGPARPRR
jgi:hypothetical protein